MNRIDRLFGILTFLQSRKHVSAEKISEKFGISVRTVYRDVKALNEQGIPIGFESSKGYYIVPGYFLPPVKFNADEANAFLLVEALVEGFADESIRKNYSAALSKIKAVLSEKEKNRVEQLSKQIKMQVPACFKLNFEFMGIIQNAIATKTILSIDYINKGEIASTRQIEPIGLIFYALHWHVIGWCHKRHEYRDFKLNRIQKLHDTAEPFVFSDHMLLSSYMEKVPVEY